MYKGVDGIVLLASGSADANIGIWNPWDFTLVKFISNAHDSRINCLKWLGPGTNFMASGGDDGSIIIWSTKTFEFLKRLDLPSNGFTLRVISLEVLSNGYLAAAMSDTIIYTWNINTAEYQFIFEVGSSVNAIKQLPNDLLVIVGSGSTIYLFDLISLNTFYAEILIELFDSINGIVIVEEHNAFLIFWSSYLTKYDYNGTTLTNLNLNYTIKSLEHSSAGK